MRALLAAVLPIGLVLGCSFSQPMPERPLYLLRPERSGPAQDGQGGVVRMLRVRAAPSFERTGFAYRVGDDAFEWDFRHRFASPPASEIRQATLEWLRDSGAFDRVLDAGELGDADWVLEGDLRAIYADLRDAPGAQLEIEFLLIDARTRQPDPVFRRRYQASTRLSRASPERLAEAWSRSLASVLTTLEADLRRVTHQADRGSPSPGARAGPGRDGSRPEP